MSNARTPQQAMADAIKSGAVQAFADGNPIQVENYGTSDWTPFMHTDPEFHSPGWGWRPAPTPRLRPRNPEEVPVGALWRDADGSVYLILARVPDGIVMATCDGKGVSTYDIDVIAGDGTSHSLDGGKTWHPCGVQEGGE